jgi:hypothetical protein
MWMWALYRGDVGKTEDVKSVETYSFFNKREDKPPRTEINDITEGPTSLYAAF